MAGEFKKQAGEPLPDRRVVQCNLTRAQATAVAGARAYVVLTNPGNGSERIVVLLRSRSGRWIEKWQDIRTLINFRVKSLPPEHPLYGHDRVCGFSDPDRTAAMLNEARDREMRRCS